MTFSNTNGTEPEAGVDLEPDYPTQNFVNVTFRVRVASRSIPPHGGQFNFARPSAACRYAPCGPSVRVDELAISRGNTHPKIATALSRGQDCLVTGNTGSGFIMALKWLQNGTACVVPSVLWCWCWRCVDAGVVLALC